MTPAEIAALRPLVVVYVLLCAVLIGWHRVQTGQWPWAE